MCFVIFTLDVDTVKGTLYALDYKKFYERVCKTAVSARASSLLISMDSKSYGRQNTSKKAAFTIGFKTAVNLILECCGL